MKFFYISLLLFPLLVVAVPPPIPSAGIVEREIEKEYQGQGLELQPEIPSIEVDIPEERLDLPSDKKILIRKIQVEGNTVISSGEIQHWIEPYEGKQVDLLEIYKICALINQNYAKEGYFLARAYPPPQEIRDGVLVLEILEGVIGSIQIEGNKYYSTLFIDRYFQRFIQKPLKYDRFLKALLLLNENTDLSAGVIFQKGKKVGTADLIIHVKDHRPLHLYLNENNYGRDLTTNSQFGGRLDWGNCLIEGDRLSVAEVVGFPMKALYFTDVRYTVPVNTYGTSVEGSFLFTRFYIEEMTSLNLRGESMIGTLKGKQAITRTQDLSIDFFSYLDFKRIENFALDTTLSLDKLSVLTMGLLVDHYNQYAGRDYLNVRASGGFSDFPSGIGFDGDFSSSLGSGKSFIQLNTDYDRLQRIYKDWMLDFHFSGQWSPDKLTLAQQIYIGGSSSVRGYPLSVAVGDSGYYANIETRIPVPFFSEGKYFSRKPWQLQLVGFVDTGGTFLSGGSNTFITGAGWGLRFAGPYTLSVSFDIGYPLNRKDLSENSFMYLRFTMQPF